MELASLIVAVCCAVYAGLTRMQWRHAESKCKLLVQAGNEVAAKNKQLSDENAKLRGSVQANALRIRELEAALLKAASTPERGRNR